jgi:predicted RNA polymerase sigma factor
MLDRIAPEQPQPYQPALALRAHCLDLLRKDGDALALYAKAITLCTHAPSRRWLEQKARAVRSRAS